MLKKIISGGQTGVDRAALDAAIEMGIEHGGWIPKGRKAEDGPLDGKYNLKEMKTSSYKARTEQNILDSDATLIVSHGKLTGGSALTKKLAEKHSRPCLHVDLSATNPFSALKAVCYWIEHNNVEVLNVAGPRLSKDPQIYEATLTLIKNIINLACIESGSTREGAFTPLLPGTVEEAVQDLLSRMTKRDKEDVGRAQEHHLPYINETLGQYVRVRYGLWSKTNQSLFQSCREAFGKDNITAEEASFLIIRCLWKDLNSGDEHQ